MAIFNDAVPANTEAVKLGAKNIRDLKTTLNSLLGTLFNDDGTPKDSTVTTDEIQDGAVISDKLAEASVILSKLADGILTADTAGRAKMADGYVTLAKILDGIFTADAAGRAKFANLFVTTEKLADASVTLEKLAPTAVIDSLDSILARARWTGAGYCIKTITKTLPTGAFPAKTRITISALPLGFPIGGAGVTTDNAPCSIIAYNVTGDGSTDPGSPTTGLTLGTLYYTYIWDANTISLHTSPQGAVDGTTDIVTLASDFHGASTYYFKAFNPATVFKRNCDVIPVVSANSFDRLHGYRIIWRTPWADALSGLIQVEQQYAASTNSNTVDVLRPTIITASQTDLYYILPTTNDWRTGANDFTTAQINAFTGANFVSAFN